METLYQSIIHSTKITMVIIIIVLVVILYHLQLITKVKLLFYIGLFGGLVGFLPKEDCTIDLEEKGAITPNKAP